MAVERCCGAQLVCKALHGGTQGPLDRFLGTIKTASFIESVAVAIKLPCKRTLVASGSWAFLEALSAAQQEEKKVRTQSVLCSQPARCPPSCRRRSCRRCRRRCRCRCRRRSVPCCCPVQALGRDWQGPVAGRRRHGCGRSGGQQHMEGLEIQGGAVAPPQGAHVGSGQAGVEGRCLHACVGTGNSRAAAACVHTFPRAWPQQHVKPHPQVFTLDWNSEGKRLASGSVDQTVRITRVDDHCGVRLAHVTCVKGSHRCCPRLLLCAQQGSTVAEPPKNAATAAWPSQPSHCCTAMRAAQTAST